ncbi:GntR family transcriptional regulator [Microbacterium album]|uniref:Transcriptional regulator n=1 Tax=Microbacterium album TaxID=2053191 RepID=A0A917IE44_9MICO|nr:GntR family transcriptional regulator [Microbacterium album]GGH43700.1 transcriptional regulator [Microbacterium album]
MAFDTDIDPHGAYEGTPADSAVAANSGHGSAGVRIADGVRAAILEGAYPPGTRVRQEDLADQYAASRVPVREALRILEAEGLITRVANAGAWVSQLNLAECEELYRVRERIEPLLLAMNVPLLAPAVDDLAELAARMERAADAEEFLSLDRAFHLATYAAADTTMLRETVVRLWNRTHHYRRAFTRVARAHGEDAAVHLDHRLLVEAIRRGDADEAEDVLYRHVRRTRVELARHPEIFPH